MAVASKRYSALSVTMKTPPVSSTEKEFPFSSPESLRERTAPLPRAIVPTIPLLETNQIRPSKSGRAEMIPSPGGTTVLRS